MGEIREHPRVRPFVAVISRYEEPLNWAREKLVEHLGVIAMESRAFPFPSGPVYKEEMGQDLKKTLLLFSNTICPQFLVECKHKTNTLERAYADYGRYPESRPLNIDPGYLTSNKLVLASTKDRAHRSYLEKGIFADPMLHYSHGAWQVAPGTYPSYATDDCLDFLIACREL